MARKTMDSYGRLDILFNNAGILGKPLDDLTEERWRWEIDIMLTGPFLASDEPSFFTGAAIPVDGGVSS